MEPKEKQSSISFRYGGTGTDMKIYFVDAEDLDIQMMELEERAPSIKGKMEKVKHILGADSN